MIIAYGVNQISKSFSQRHQVTFVTTVSEKLDDGTNTVSLENFLELNIDEIEKIIVFSSFYDEVIDNLIKNDIPKKLIQIYDHYAKKIIPLSTVIKNNYYNDSETITCFYDLKYCHLTFDFLYYLLNCEVEKIKQNKKYLKIVIVPKFTCGRNHLNIQLGANEEDTKLRINGIILQMLSNLDDVVGVYQPPCREEAFELFNNKSINCFPNNYLKKKKMRQYSLSEIDRDIFINKLEYWQFIKPSKLATQNIEQYLINVKHKKIICITLRDYPHETHRQSNYKEWEQFIDSLDKERFFPIVVKDTYSVYKQGIQGCNVFEPASFDLQLRIALYAKADLNLSVNCGPSALFYFIQNCNSIEFRYVNDQSLSTSQAHMARVSKMHLGEQPFYGNNGRNLVYWGVDSFTNISNIFATYLKL